MVNFFGSRCCPFNTRWMFTAWFHQSQSVASRRPRKLRGGGCKSSLGQISQNLIEIRQKKPSEKSDKFLKNGSIFDKNFTLSTNCRRNFQHWAISFLIFKHSFIIKKSDMFFSLFISHIFPFFVTLFVIIFLYVIPIVPVLLITCTGSDGEVSSLWWRHSWQYSF